MPMGRKELQMTNVAKLPVAEGPTFLDYSAHPFAATFPMIEGHAFEDLKSDVRQRGIFEPIWAIGQWAFANFVGNSSSPFTSFKAFC